MRKNEVWGAFARAGGALAVACAMQGCGSLRTDPIPRQVTTNIAVLSVTDFEAVRSKLQPKFQMDAATALSRSLPTTGASATSELDLARAAFALSMNLAPSADEETSAPVTAPEPGSPVTKTTVDGTKTIVERSGGRTDTQALGGLSLPADLAALLAARKDLEFNPALQHQIAQSLVQQVELLNVVVGDAAIPRDHVAYVVQLQLTVLPRQSDLDLDVYADVGFFWQGVPSKPSSDHPAQGGPDQPTSEQRVDRLARDVKASIDAAEKKRSTADGAIPPRLVRVLPLVGTDSIETFVQGARDQRIRELAAELRVSALKIGAGADVQRRIDELQASIGRRFFSTFSMGRLSENTIRVRLGAQPSGDGKGALVARTHRIPVLLIVPKVFAEQPNAEVLATSAISVFDGKTGGRVRELDERGLSRVAAKSLRPYFGGHLPERDDLIALADSVASNSFEKFTGTVKALSEKSKAPTLADLNPELLWLEIANLINLSQFSGQRFTLPPPLEPTLAGLDGLLVPVVIEPDKPVVAYIPGLRSPARERASATLRAAPDVRWPASEIKPFGDGAVVTFPPALFAALKGNGSVSIDLALPGSMQAQLSGRITNLEKPKDDAKKPLAISITADAVTVDDAGTGTLVLMIEALDPEKTKPPFNAVLLVKSGASVTEWQLGESKVTSAQIAEHGGATIAGPSRVQLKLANLVPDSAVRIELREIKSKENPGGALLADPLELKVRAGS